jgi:hypothetical protein
MQCFLGPEPADGFQIMPASVMLPSGSILTATRTTGPASIEMVAGATGGGVRSFCTTKAVFAPLLFDCESVATTGSGQTEGKLAIETL